MSSGGEEKKRVSKEGGVGVIGRAKEAVVAVAIAATMVVVGG